MTRRANLIPLRERIHRGIIAQLPSRRDSNLTGPRLLINEGVGPLTKGSTMIHLGKESAARRNVRLKAERSIRQAAKLLAYLAKREREAGRTNVADIESYENGSGI